MDSFNPWMENTIQPEIKHKEQGENYTYWRGQLYKVGDPRIPHKNPVYEKNGRTSEKLSVYFQFRDEIRTEYIYLIDENKKFYAVDSARANWHIF